jgi:epoxyqueuosine reductase
MQEMDSINWVALAGKIRDWGQDIGLCRSGHRPPRHHRGHTRPDALAGTWPPRGHGLYGQTCPLRADPAALHPGTISIISVRLPYWPEGRRCRRRSWPTAGWPMSHATPWAATTTKPFAAACRSWPIASPPSWRRIRLPRLQLPRLFGFGAGHGGRIRPPGGTAWRGKHTLSLTRSGSYHFLGELYTSLPLPPDAPHRRTLRQLHGCIDVCPTQAIVAPYEVDARRCISYLTIELAGAIPEELRPLIGNRIYGCDDCQLCCPWNRFATAGDPDFAPRNGLDASTLISLFAWSESRVRYPPAGSPIRRIGHERWLRNIAVALGNADNHARRQSPPCPAGPDTRHRWSASMSPGHCASTKNSPCKTIAPSYKA